MTNSILSPGIKPPGQSSERWMRKETYSSKRRDSST